MRDTLYPRDFWSARKSFFLRPLSPPPLSLLSQWSWDDPPLSLLLLSSLFVFPACCFLVSSVCVCVRMAN